MRCLVIGTTTHESNSTSWTLASFLPKLNPAVEFKFIDADKLHIVKNLSCYSGGGKNCSSPDAGPYRCWAHFNSVSDPIKYGGVDEMPVIYEGINWSDTVIFCTSVRWGSHTSLLQKVIERMNTLENRVTVYGELSPLKNKKCGVIVTGQHWKSQEVASHLSEIFNYMGFISLPEYNLSWQKTWDKDLGQVSNNDDALIHSLKDENFIPLIKFNNALFGVL